MEGLLTDEARLRVFAALALGECLVPDIARKTGLDEDTVTWALDRLQQVGVANGAGGWWSLRREALRGWNAADSFTADPPPAVAQPSVVLRAFFPGGRLVSLPTAPEKRRMVLEHVVRMFEPGERHSEREVDALLRVLYDDAPLLRTALVEVGLLRRSGSAYVRG